MQGCGGGSGISTPAPPFSPTSSTIQVAPASLSLTGAGSATAKTFIATENFYTGTLSETDTCNPSAGTIASISPASGSGQVTFTVTPRAIGNCSVKISDANSQSATVSVSVVGSIVLAPASLSLNATGSAQTFAASESNYTGTFTQSNTCNPSGGAIAAITPASGTAPVTFTVTPQGGGSCTVTVSDSNGQNAPVTVSVAFPITLFSSGISHNAQPLFITAGPDGNQWFTEFRGQATGRITPSGVITEFSAGMTPPGSNPFGSDDFPYGITAGPDGNVWFAQEGSAHVGRIAPDGTITEFPIGSTGGGGITTGPDGNLWFALANDRIGRITPSGSETEFSSGISSGSLPLTITAGPDGNLWFTERNGSRIGRITPGGVVTEFSSGISSGSWPYGITAGPDGNLWFTEYQSSRIGRITPSGTVTEFSTGISASSNPNFITAGPDGNLWFTEDSTGRIGRITPSGTVTEFSTGSGSGSRPSGITVGTDGNLWFTEVNGNDIGRLGMH